MSVDVDCPGWCHLRRTDGVVLVTSLMTNDSTSFAVSSSESLLLK